MLLYFVYVQHRILSGLLARMARFCGNFCRSCWLSGMGCFSWFLMVDDGRLLLLVAAAAGLSAHHSLFTTSHQTASVLHDQFCFLTISFLHTSDTIFSLSLLFFVFYYSFYFHYFAWKVIYLYPYGLNYREDQDLYGFNVIVVGSSLKLYGRKFIFNIKEKLFNYYKHRDPGWMYINV